MTEKGASMQARRNTVHTSASGNKTIVLPQGRPILFITKDLDALRQQLDGTLVLKAVDMQVGDLMDDINTDAIAPAWVCFRHRPEDIAKDSYAGMVDEQGRRLFRSNVIQERGFVGIAAGRQKGCGSSRETAPQAERWSGIEIVAAESFAPIYLSNAINLGLLPLMLSDLRLLEKGISIDLNEIAKRHGEPRSSILIAGDLFRFWELYRDGPPSPAAAQLSRPLTLIEKIIVTNQRSSKRPSNPENVRPGAVAVVEVDVGYSHDFTSAQVHNFALEAYGNDYRIRHPERFAAFADHLALAEAVPRFAPFAEQIKELRTLQDEFVARNGLQSFGGPNADTNGICHQIAREKLIKPGDIVVATDSHTCMGGASNALAFGVGATEYAASMVNGLALVRVPETVRFELVGRLRPGCMAKDLILFILAEYATKEITLDRCMEFGGEGLSTLDMDERATLCNMATECSAFTAICEGDERTVEWMSRHIGLASKAARSRLMVPDQDADYKGGRYRIDLSTVLPMLAKPGDPKFGTELSELRGTRIDIAYGGSCTAGKYSDVDAYAEVLGRAEQRNEKLAETTRFFIQLGSSAVEKYATDRGYISLFERMGVILVKPGCGACIGCGPGVSTSKDQVTLSAINRNFAGRSGPGSVYLASPYTVAASALTGTISPYMPDGTQVPI
jgi:3-isopropylmalate/(R)-2-methylmalate dehydratase large subunit